MRKTVISAKISKSKGHNLQKSTERNETRTSSVTHQVRLAYQKSAQYMKAFWKKVWKTEKWRTDGVTRLLDLLPPSATQVKSDKKSYQE